MSKCSECGKKYTDDDCSQDDANIPQVERGTCKHCAHRCDKGKCERLLQPGNGPIDDFVVTNGLTVTPAPDFSCGLFKFKGKS